MRSFWWGKRLSLHINWFKSLRYHIRCVFFIYLAARGRILMAENLGKRKVTYVRWCFMSNGSREDVDNLLLHCQVASRQLWNFWDDLELSGYVKTIFSWKYCTWNIARLALMWIVWREINRQVVRCRDDFFYNWGVVSYPYRFLVCPWSSWVLFVENHILYMSFLGTIDNKVY